ncbi:MAG: glutathione S-transferase family protein [Rhizomicrobium sp.]
MITVSAFKWVPPFAQGVVRDLRVRWALEEAGMTYESKLIGFEDQKTPAYRAMQPFGQVPAYQEDGLVLFESGAILLHIARRSAILLPTDLAARDRAITWLFCALNTIEVVVQPYAELDAFHAGEAWTQARRPQLAARVRLRLQELAASLGDKDYLDGRFTAGDLMMTTVLRILRGTDFVAAEPALASYQQRCEARPAFQRALAAQMGDFEQR